MCLPINNLQSLLKTQCTSTYPKDNLQPGITPELLPQKDTEICITDGPPRCPGATSTPPSPDEVMICTHKLESCGLLFGLGRQAHAQLDLLLDGTRQVLDHDDILVVGLEVVL